MFIRCLFFCSRYTLGLAAKDTHKEVDDELSVSHFPHHPYKFRFLHFPMIILSLLIICHLLIHDIAGFPFSMPLLANSDTTTVFRRRLMVNRCNNYLQTRNLRYQSIDHFRSTTGIHGGAADVSTSLSFATTDATTSSNSNEKNDDDDDDKIKNRTKVDPTMAAAAAAGATTTTTTNAPTTNPDTLAKFLTLLFKGITLPFPTLRNLAEQSSPPSSMDSKERQDKIHVGFSLRESLLAIIIYLILGVISYSSTILQHDQAWSLVDALYFGGT